MAVARGGLSVFHIKLVDASRAGGYARSLCPLQSSKLMLEPFAETTNL